MEPTSDAQAPAQLTGAIGRWEQGATCLAALAVAADPGTEGPLAQAARDVMAATGLGDALVAPGRLPFPPAQVWGMAASPVLQAAALAGGTRDGWAAQSDAALTAQGLASGSAGALFARFVLPHLGDLADRLAAPGARMLDVGTGIGALAVGFAQAFPQLHVTGIDVLPRVLELARAHVGASPVSSRVELRRQDVAELADEERYDLAWLPAPFVPEPAVRAGIARITRALRPGGAIMIGHGTFDGTDLDKALARFRTVAYGGTPLDGASAAGLLHEQALTSVLTVPMPPGAPAITVGRRP